MLGNRYPLADQAEQYEQKTNTNPNNMLENFQKVLFTKIEIFLILKSVWNKMFSC